MLIWMCMAELVPAPFRDLVARLYREPRRQNAIFELPRSRWHLPAPGGPDLGVRFHGRPAGNCVGPAAGPHTQMAQNLLLSYAAGARILELKTVQVNDRLTIPRPCIDMTNVGYNVEWSQELLVEQSLREYVAGAMLVHMFRFAHPETGDALRGPAGEVIYDISVGYDLAGIMSDKVRAFLDGMRNAGPTVEALRLKIPAEHAVARDLDFPTRLSDTITLSTFHGCPADEIERICEFLIGACGFDVIVKMNPPMLGREKLEHLLQDVLGYRELTVNPEAYRTGLAFDDGVALCRRLSGFAAARGRSFGAKFSNTLEVLNHRDFFTSDNKVMYLSGQPLHVITMTLTDEFRRAMGPDFPISFSAGIDQHNFPLVAACGIVPVTISTDLLRPGGYGRLTAYLQRLSAAMEKCGAATMDDFVLLAFGNDSAAARHVEREGGAGGPSGSPRESVVRRAGLLNTAVVAEMARNDARYRAEQNRKVPKRIDRQLAIFDCITCDKCLPVCPNAANFVYPTPQVAFDYHDIIVSRPQPLLVKGGLSTPPLCKGGQGGVEDGDGAPAARWRLGDKRHFEITEPMQIACYADFCNECGNCDTFCPEYGGPYIKKPAFFGSLESWQRAAPRDGFVVGRAAGGEPWIRGRIRGAEYLLTEETEGTAAFEDGEVRARFAPDRVTVVTLDYLAPPSPPAERRLDLWAFHTMRHLLCGVLDSSRVNQINAGQD